MNQSNPPQPTTSMPRPESRQPWETPLCLPLDIGEGTAKPANAVETTTPMTTKGPAS